MTMPQVTRRTKSLEIEKIKEKLQKLEERQVMETCTQPKKTLQEVLERLQQNYENFSDKKNFTQLYIAPQKPATYLIYEGSEIIYVGSSIHLRTRLKQLLSGGGHVFHNKLRELLGTKNNVQKFLRTNCSFRYSLCKDKREANLLEALCINIYLPKFND